MADNPFETASDLVGGLKKEYQELNDKLPKLRALKEAATEELTELNKKVVAAQETLDGLTEQITINTEAYNTWQRGELATLEAGKTALAKEKTDFDIETTEKRNKIVEDEATNTKTAQELDAFRARLNRDKDDIAAQVRVNNTAADNLRGRESQIQAAEAANTTLATDLATRATELDQREQKIAEAEKEITTALQEADRQRQAAKTLLDNAKETIQNTDAREDANELRKKQLDAREQKLKAKEIQLEDRITTIATH